MMYAMSTREGMTLPDCWLQVVTIGMDASESQEIARQAAVAAVTTCTALCEKAAVGISNA